MREPDTSVRFDMLNRLSHLSGLKPNWRKALLCEQGTTYLRTPPPSLDQLAGPSFVISVPPISNEVVLWVY